MYIIRTISPILKVFFNLNTDLVGLTDTWAKGFVAECDYLTEASNAVQFQKSIVETPLKDIVFVPAVLPGLMIEKVLTSEWVVGKHLDKSNKDDVKILCSIVMNSYFTMMIETGLLHCDPHPGEFWCLDERRWIRVGECKQGHYQSSGFDHEAEKYLSDSTLLCVHC